MSLIDDAADWFKDRKTHVLDWYSDEQGRYAFSVRIEGITFVVSAKKYLHEGDASFMASKVVKRARDMDALLLLFVSDGKQLVFDPETVAAVGDHGEPADSDRLARGETWVDINADLSVSFRDWYDQGQEPPTKDDVIGEDNDRPSRPHDVTAWGDDDG